MKRMLLNLHMRDSKIRPTNRLNLLLLLWFLLLSLLHRVIPAPLLIVDASTSSAAKIAEIAGQGKVLPGK